MELTIRDWMVIIGAGLILAVLVDAARRVYRERRKEVRLNARITRCDEPGDDDDEFNLLSELPNGGARIVTRDDLMPGSETADDSAEQADPAEAASDVVTRADESLDETASSGSGNPDALGVEDDYPVSSFSAIDDDDLFDHTAASEMSAREPTTKTNTSTADVAETLDWLEQLNAPEPEEAPEARLPRGVEPHVFVLNVVARQESGFAGSDVLQILLACDLRFGDMDFFHRHEQSAGRGPIQFSVANMLKPGVFDIDTMDTLYTRGLMFFVTLPGPEDMLKAFDYMYETAKTVAKNLDGDVLDETRSAVTRQSLEHTRQQIRELERRIAVGRQR